MKKTKSTRRPAVDSIERYDWGAGIRGKYATTASAASALLRILEPDIAQRFPDSGSVNVALRGILELADTIPRRRDRSRRAA